VPGVKRPLIQMNVDVTQQAEPRAHRSLPAHAGQHPFTVHALRI
jgi:hypothetical protein